MAACYRHPSRETGVACSSCGRAICPDCMTPTPVGMRCPECSRDRTRVRRVASSGPGVGLAGVSMTHVLIAINVLVFFAETATGTPLGGVSGAHVGTLYYDGALIGPYYITQHHEYYRMLTAAFLHDGLLHILFNMVFLYLVGPSLEMAIGKVKFVVVYFASLFAGSFGALLFQPMSPTVGASGALFGLLGALMVVAYYRGISIWRSGLGITLLINVIFSLSVAGISIGGHLGGLVGGAICGWLIVQVGERRRLPAAAIAGCALVAAVGIVAGIAVAGNVGLTPNGINLY
ncbi:MAG: rhomboid family intramembrane serine protease [Solirubrobacterales bacterium]|nr:rhomboid family intramembrane serine protease [Solirubrobacterales bacterium]